MTSRIGSAAIALAVALGSPAWAAKVYVPYAVNQEDRGASQRTELLLTNGQPVGLTGEQAANFAELQAQLQELLASEPACYADGNLDKRVDAADWKGVFGNWGQPSVFDFNQDGTTNDADLQCVASNFANDCRLRGPGKACK